MIATILKLIAGPVAGKVLDVITAHDNAKTDRAQLRTEIEKAIVGAMPEITAHQAAVVKAEIGGEGWLQRNWRPCVALAFAGIIVFYGLILPVAVDWFGAPPVRIGDALLGWIMQAVLICLGGYIGGRTIEKLAKVFDRKVL